MYFAVSWLEPRLLINSSASEWTEEKTGPKDVSMQKKCFFYCRRLDIRNKRPCFNYALMIFWKAKVSYLIFWVLKFRHRCIPEVSAFPGTDEKWEKQRLILWPSGPLTAHNHPISCVAASQRVTCEPEVPVVPRAGDLRAGDLRHPASAERDVRGPRNEEQDYKLRAGVSSDLSNIC